MCRKNGESDKKKKNSFESTRKWLLERNKGCRSEFVTGLWFQHSHRKKGVLEMYCSLASKIPTGT